TRPTGSTLFPYTTLFRSNFFFLNQVVPYGCSSAIGQLLQIGSGYTLVLHEEGFHLLNIGILWFVRRSRFAVELFNRFIDLCSRRSEEHTSELQSRFDLVC